jgi:hypothetical protein
LISHALFPFYKPPCLSTKGFLKSLDAMGLERLVCNLFYDTPLPPPGLLGIMYVTFLHIKLTFISCITCLCCTLSRCTLGILVGTYFCTLHDHRPIRYVFMSLSSRIVSNLSDLCRIASSSGAGFSAAFSMSGHR